MLNYIIGKEIKILPGELIAHIKAGRLHPVDKFLRPILSPAIKAKLDREKKLNMELRYLPLEYGKLETGKVIIRGCRSLPAYSKDEEKRKLDERGTSLQKEIDALNKELDAIKDKNDWTTFDLPEDPKSAQGVFDLLMRSYFKREDVEAIAIAIPEICQNKKDLPERVTTEPTPQLKEMSNFITKVKKEFISGSEILNKRKIEKYVLMDLVRNGLEPWHPVSLKPIRKKIGKVYSCVIDDSYYIPEKYIESPKTLPYLFYTIEELYPFLEECLFLKEDVEVIVETNPKILNTPALENMLSQIESESQPNIIPTDAPQFATAINTANFFKRNDDFWTIRYEGKESKPIKHIDGFLYIASLLKRPGMSISCAELYQAKIGQHPGTVSAGAAIAEDLHTGTNKQYKSDSKAKEAIWKRWQEYQDNIDNAEDTPEGEMVKKENRKKQDELKPYLNEGAFAEKNKQTQVNMTKRLEAAYDKLEKRGMKSLSKHLRVNIKPNGAYDLVYNSETSWEISIK